jgi:serine phosphatase RsbU (regulator of sigma subunit)
MVLWRAIPMACAAVFLALTFTSLRKSRPVVMTVYFLFLAGAMAMMCALAALTAGTHYFHDAISGMVVVIFAIFLVSEGRLRFLLPVYTVPFAAMLAYIDIFSMNRMQVIALSNPVAMAALAILLSQVQERLRFREFRATRTARLQNAQLKQQSAIIEKRDAQFRREVHLSANIQQNLLPSSPPKMKDVEFSTLYLPMRELGGDFYDFIRFKDPDSIGIFISDVTGHGVPSALITSMIKALLETAGVKRMKPGELLSFINKKLKGIISGNYLTAFYAVYNTGTRRLKFARGGHPLPFLMRAGEGDIRPLRSRGVILGAFERPSFEVREIELRPGDKLIFYTDGLLEAMDRGKRQFESRFMEILAQAHARNIRSLVKSVHQELIDFAGASDFQDDICVIGMEVR